MESSDPEQLGGQIFALVTALFEDGAGRAIDEQRPAGKEMTALIAALHTYADDIVKLLGAADVVYRSKA